MNQPLQAPSPPFREAGPLGYRAFSGETPGIDKKNFGPFRLRRLREWWEVIVSGKVPGAWGGEDAPRREGRLRPAGQRGGGKAPPGLGTLQTAAGLGQLRETRLPEASASPPGASRRPTAGGSQPDAASSAERQVSPRDALRGGPCETRGAPILPGDRPVPRPGQALRTPRPHEGCPVSEQDVW